MEIYNSVVKFLTIFLKLGYQIQLIVFSRSASFRNLKANQKNIRFPL